ncbi:MAG: metallophosphoesterase [Gemmatimonadetes bacterium]|nr:metallophosphoesterase [Gemmatimonadota bacterium]MBK9547544.1 metallophosphoesterase [Gemmatimonadota bacterium]MBP9897560.1 metallophosphoesterase [Gemmatimonadales bacterium]
MERRPFVRLAGLSALTGLFGARQTAWASTPALAAPRPAPGSWSFVLLPDTQCYSESYPDVFMAQTEWIARQRQARNIQFVLHLGDITNNNVHPEWINARRAMDVLRQAGIPHLLVPGNHDMGTWGNADSRESFFSDYFIQRNARVGGESENAFLRVTVGEAKFLIVGLEFGPRDKVVDWANEIVAKYPDHHAILVTHAYMYSDDQRFHWTGPGKAQSWNPNAYPVGTNPALAAEGVNDGEALWQKLVSRHRQFLFTFNGHVLNDGIGTLESKAPLGHSVHQMLVNYQCGVTPDRKKGGGGFLRLVEVQADGRTVNISDYSPYYDQWLTEPDRKFTIAVDRDLNKPFAP